jgi:uncharacterized protein
VAQKRKVQVKCPICKQLVIAGSEDFPFCSQRCRLIDLGKWASGQYVITSPAQDASDSLSLDDLANDSDED